MVSFTNPNFSNTILTYHPTQGLKEIVKKSSSYRIANFFIKLFRYIFDSSSRISNVLEGLTLEAKKITKDPKKNVIQYIRYANVFKRQVVDVHNSRQGTPIDTKNLDQEIKDLYSSLGLSSETTQELENYILNPALQINITNENFIPLAKIAQKYQLNDVLDRCDEYGAHYFSSFIEEINEDPIFYKSLSECNLEKTNAAIHKVFITLPKNLQIHILENTTIIQITKDNLFLFAKYAKNKNLGILRKQCDEFASKLDFSWFKNDKEVKEFFNKLISYQLNLTKKALKKQFSHISNIHLSQTINVSKLGTLFNSAAYILKECLISIKNNKWPEELSHPAISESQRRQFLKIHGKNITFFYGDVSALPLLTEFCPNIEYIALYKVKGQLARFTKTEAEMIIKLGKAQELVFTNILCEEDLFQIELAAIAMLANCSLKHIFVPLATVIEKNPLPFKDPKNLTDLFSGNRYHLTMVHIDNCVEVGIKEIKLYNTFQSDKHYYAYIKILAHQYDPKY